MDEKKPINQSSDSNLMAALSYLWIISVVMIIIKKNDSYVMFHAKQGLILFIISFICWFTWFIPFIGAIIAIIVFIGIVIGFLKAYNGEKYKMPVIGDLAEKIHI